MCRTIDCLLERTDPGFLTKIGSEFVAVFARSVPVMAMVVALWPANLVHAQDSLPSCGDWPFGSTRELALDQERNLLFASSGGAVVIQDVSDPSAPVVLSDVIRTQGLVSDLFYDESNLRLYIAADEGGLEVWGIADATAPVQLGTLDLFHTADRDVPVPARSVVAQGNMAYVAVDFAGVQFIDVTDPKNMFRSGASNGAVGGTMIFLQRAFSLAIDDGFVYASGNNFVKFQILQNGALQAIKGNTSFSFEVHIDGDFAYLVGTSGNSNIVILDTIGFPGDPILPTVAFHVLPGGSLFDAFVQNDIAYIANPGAFTTWDVSDPTNFQPIALFDHASAELIIDGGIAYGAAGDDTLLIDVSDPANPALLASVESPGSLVFGAATDGGLAFLAVSTQGLRVLDVTDASNPVTIGQLDTPDFALDIVTRDNTAFLANAFSGLYIVDVSDPTNPIMIGNLDVFTYARRVVVDGDYAYVTDLFDGVRVVDISDPANPQEAALIFSGVFTTDVFVQGDLLFICNDNGLDIFDISTPARPAPLGTLPLPDAHSVAVEGNFAYVTDFESLHVIDIADPGSPAIVGLLTRDTLFFSSELKVQDGLAFVTDAIGGLAIIDVSIPSNPTEVQYIDTPGSAFNVSLDGGRVYISDGQAGLRIFGDCEIGTPGDLNGDGTVGASDLLILLASWGPCGDCDDCIADLDDDCTVGASDLLTLLANWG